MATVLALPKAQEPGLSEAGWREASWLPCRLTSEIAVAGFTVGDLMSIETGSVVVTRTPTSSDVLVRVNGELIGRAELDAVGDHFAVRITELA
ncbi:MAG TPA: FliM/FliN family flagellar motor C-terminal domain-containing protein [Candidatus Acidoferrales bacterium]|nr:FliM/FliN family flagellar motor C-terminal domain-containing protein [Candidatus Acidoferrales bacterium]